MYGTIARMKVKPGHEAHMQELDENADLADAGMVFAHVYKLDNTDNEYIMVAGFESKDAYVANANSPEQHQRYERYMEHLEGDPEWNDGEIVMSRG